MVKNSDPGTRRFTVEALGSDMPVNPGSETAAELRDLPAGTYTFSCRLFGHEAFMTGARAGAASARRTDAARGGARDHRP